MDHSPRMYSVRFMQEMWSLLAATFNDWYEDRAQRMGAALAYYTIFALTPGLVILMALAGLLLGPGAESQIIEQIRELIGEQGAVAIEATITSARHATAGSADRARPVPPRHRALGRLRRAPGWAQHDLGCDAEAGRRVRDIVKERFWSFAMVVGIGFLLLVSLVLSAWLAAVSTYCGPTPARSGRGARSPELRHLLRRDHRRSSP